MRGRDKNATRDDESDSDGYITASEEIEPDDDQSSSETARTKRHSAQARDGGQSARFGRLVGWKGFRRTHPPLEPTPGFRKCPRRKLPATDEYAERWMNPTEMAQYWYEKFKKQKDRVKQKDTEIEELDVEIANWDAAYRAQFDRAEREAAKYKAENEKLEKLLTSHVRAVNSVGSGLEPVTDQRFAEKFEKLHHEVSMWCRSGFKKPVGDEPKPEADNEAMARQLLQPRVQNIDSLRFHEIIDCVVWACVETVVFPDKMPGPGYDDLRFLSTLQSCIQRGDTTSDGEKTSIWLSQTCSLLFQDPEFQRCLTDVSSLALDLVTILCAVPRRPCFQEEYLGCIEDSLRSIKTVAAEMRCQRGSFKLDTSVTLGAPYDEKTMKDVRFTDIEDGMQASVVAVLSRGWIRIPPKEVGGVERHICKTRVVVKVADAE